MKSTAKKMTAMAIVIWKRWAMNLPSPVNISKNRLKILIHLLKHPFPKGWIPRTPMQRRKPSKCLRPNICPNWKSMSNKRSSLQVATVIHPPIRMPPSSAPKTVDYFQHTTLSLAPRTNSSRISVFTKKLLRPTSSYNTLNSSRRLPGSYPEASLAMLPMAVRRTITISRCIRLSHYLNTIPITLNEQRSIETMPIIKTSSDKTLTMEPTPARKAERWNSSTPTLEPLTMDMNKPFIPTSVTIAADALLPISVRRATAIEPSRSIRN